MRTNVIQLVILLALCFSIIGCEKHKQFSTEEVMLIPQPQKMQIGNSSFSFSKRTKFICAKEFAPIANQIIQKFETAADFSPKVYTENSAVKNVVLFNQNNELEPEEYLLNVTEEKIVIEAAKYAGFFNAMQTIRQLLPSQIESTQLTENVEWWVPTIQIKDSPRFKWRGFMVDVSRHFMPKEYIFQLFDLMAMHKINTFHFHLVDDQGWRIEIKKYPKLTDIGAWRVDHNEKGWDDRPKQQKSEKATYGGFYTQEDIKEMIRYAEVRNITIIPEIEMPAHTTSSLAAYPQFSCTGGPFTVPPGGVWPITDIYCAGNDSTFHFLENILTEVIDLFPSKYIHIGGDEAHKKEWKKCPKCKKRVKTEKLKNVEELQSYFIKRIEKFINEKGRVLMGWDEILEGGLAPRATVMSWRGYEGGIKAAKAGHDVVMTPTTPCYFDYYQGAIDKEPKAWGGYNPISKVYDFDPVHKSMNAQDAKHVLGGQANLWTEHIPNTEHAMYMTFPRLAALAEAVWTNKEHKDWNRFSNNIKQLLHRYDLLEVKYAQSAFSLTANTQLNKENNQLGITLASELANLPIRYTIDGTEPTISSTLYSMPVPLKQTTTIKAATFANGKRIGDILTQKFNFHKAIAKPVNQINPVHSNYTGQEDVTLVNSVRGSKNLADGQWQAWLVKNMEAVIDLKFKQKINTVTVGTLQSNGAHVFIPKQVVVMGSSDGALYQKLGTLNHTIDPLNKELIIHDFKLENINKEVRYLKVIAQNLGRCPKGHKSEGQKAWIFLDEIIVE